MTRWRRIVITAAAITAAACLIDPRTPPERNAQPLDRAFVLAAADPAAAARLFEACGPAPGLEHARMATWASCLSRSDAPPAAWRRYLDARPPSDLAHRAGLTLIQALLDEGRTDEALTHRSILPSELQPEADELLLGSDEPEVRQEAARSLLVTGPHRLHRVAPDLERRLVPTLAPEERLQRSRAWRRAGAPSRAAAELRSLRWNGDAEVERRRELARAEIEVGSTRRALRVLPTGRRAAAEDQVLRAQAHRRRAWQRVPDRAATASFRDCQTAARQALAGTLEDEFRTQALVLHLECATEAGRPTIALGSWRELQSRRWSDPRREWLGRRLGVGLARAGRPVNEVNEIGSVLPTHERCLRFWVADRRGSDRDELNTLAAAGFADLYGQWAREDTGQPGPMTAVLAPAIEPGPEPTQVRRLFDAGLDLMALRQWRLIRSLRMAAPEEGIAASDLNYRRGRANESIRWLRSAFPELGTVDMNAAPENAVRGYLPLRWHEALTSAAEEFGLDPWLLAAVARQESVFIEDARSSRGAVGVLQLVPGTARGHARALGLGRSPDLTDPEINIRLGARELDRLLRRFGAVEPALAAYNAGETRARGWWRRWPDRRRFTEEVPVPETYNYIRRVVFLAEAYRLVYAERWGVRP
ncbi:MAG: transglycosylase SLT domain-containing protein [Thermoanaerobaculales bacterium]